MKKRSSYERPSDFNRSSPSSNATSSDNNGQREYFNSNYMDGSQSSCQVVSNAKPSSPPKKILPMTKTPSASNSAKAITEEKSLCEIGFNMTEIEDWDKIVQPHKEDLMGLLKNMIDNYIKTNVKIEIGNQTFNCHMMVLQCYSDFFMNLEMKNEKVVSLPAEKVTPEAFVMAYDWMLASQPMVQREGILELYNAAKFLKIRGLVDQCWVCLDDHQRFCEDTAFLLYLESRKYDLDLVKKLMLARICKFFLTLVASKEFLELAKDEICTLLVSNSIGVNSEAEVLMVATRWLSYDWENRSQYMLDVISCVRFGLMPPWLLVALRRNNHGEELQRIVKTPQVQKMIDDGISYGTTKFYYSSNSENFVNFLDNFKLTAPVQRQWICDASCAYHQRTDCPNKEYITYESFLEYLHMIRSLGRNHWKTVQTRHGSEPNFGSYDNHRLMKESGIEAVCCCTVNSNDKRHLRGSLSSSTSLSSQLNCNRRECKYRHFANSTKSTSSNDSVAHWSINNNNSRTPRKGDNVDSVRTPPLSPHTEFPLLCNINQNDDKNRNAPSQLMRLSSSHADINIQRKQLGRLSTSVTDTNLMSTEPQTIKAKDAGTETGTGVACKPFAVSKLNLITNEKILIFGGVDPYSTMQVDGDGKYVFYYDIYENHWKSLSMMPTSKHHHAIAVLKSKVYVIGGTKMPGKKSPRPIMSTSVWRFDPHHFEWSMETILPEPRRDFAVVASQAEDGFYVIGGEGADGSILSSTLYYNVNEGKWHIKGSLNIGRTGLAAILVDKDIWIAGGMIGSTYEQSSVITDTMEAYNFEKDVWKKIGHLRMPRAFSPLCVTDKGELFLVGGIGISLERNIFSLSTIDKYEFESKQWKPVAKLTTPRHSHAVINIDNKMFVVGGVSTQKHSSLSSIECLSTEKMEWIQGISPLPKPLSGLAAAKIL